MLIFSVSFQFYRRNHLKLRAAASPQMKPNNSSTLQNRIPRHPYCTPTMLIFSVSFQLYRRNQVKSNRKPQITEEAQQQQLPRKQCPPPRPTQPLPFNVKSSSPHFLCGAAALPPKYPFQLHAVSLPPPTLPCGARAAATPPPDPSQTSAALGQPLPPSLLLAPPPQPCSAGAAATPQPPLAPLPPRQPLFPSLLSHPSPPPPQPCGAGAAATSQPPLTPLPRPPQPCGAGQPLPHPKPSHTLPPRLP